MTIHVPFYYIRTRKHINTTKEKSRSPPNASSHILPGDSRDFRKPIKTKRAAATWSR
jgi:hypothetical protein